MFAGHAAAAGSNCASISSRVVAAQPSDSAICASARSHADLGERHGAVALGQPRPVLVEHQRDVRVRRLRIAQQLREIRLARRRRQQVVTAHHLVDALCRVVDDDREVVGRHPVAATDHEVVDDAGVLAVQQVVDRVDDGVGA